MKKLTLLAVLLMGFAAANTSNAASFFGEDLNSSGGPVSTSWPNADAAHSAFLANLIGVGTETFESYALRTGSPLGINFVGAGTATLNGGLFVENNSTGAGSGGIPYGRQNVTPGGSQYWETTTGFTINFSDPVAAFGFYGTDIGDFNGQLTLTLVSGGTIVVTVPNTINSASGSVLYYGYIDEANPFTSVAFGNTAAGVDYFGFDDMTIGSVEQVIPGGVPEVSSTLVLMGLGLCGLGILRKKVA